MTYCVLNPLQAEFQSAKMCFFFTYPR